MPSTDDTLAKLDELLHKNVKRGEGKKVEVAGEELILCPVCSREDCCYTVRVKRGA